jgi:hypothetical protein
LKKPKINPSDFRGVPENVMNYICYLEGLKVVDKTNEDMLVEFVTDLSNASRYRSHDLGSNDSISDDWVDDANDLLKKISEYENM